MDYAEANALLQGRCKDRRKVANNTYLERRDREGLNSCNAIAVKLHDTDVLTFFPDGRVLFDTGGWRTVTTKERINRFGPVNVWSDRGIWYAGGTSWVQGSGNVVFAEGMIWDGEQFHGARTKDQLKAEKKERKDVAKFAKRFLDSLEAGNVAAPSGGDCWFCALTAEGGLTLGEVQGDVTHLREHVKESYFVPSLLHRAIFNDWSGASHSQSMKAWVASFWQADAAQWRQWGERDRVEKALRKYVLKSLGHAA